MKNKELRAQYKALLDAFVTGCKAIESRSGDDNGLLFWAKAAQGEPQRQLDKLGDVVTVAAPKVTQPKQEKLAPVAHSGEAVVKFVAATLEREVVAQVSAEVADAFGMRGIPNVIVTEAAGDVVQIRKVEPPKPAGDNLSEDQILEVAKKMPEFAGKKFVAAWRERNLNTDSTDASGLEM